MRDTAGQKNWITRVRIIIFYSSVIFLSVLALITMGLKLYLLSPYPARQLSTLLSSYLQQPATVQTVHASGPNLYFIGLSIADPPGFTKGNLLTVQSLTIKPQWQGLLRGRRVFRLIELDGLTVDLHRNSSGRWNFTNLRQRFAKPASGETTIRQLTIKQGAFTVNGRTAADIALSVQDLTTKGSMESRIDLTFRDEARNRYSLNGTGRGGEEAAFDLTLTGHDLSLAGLAKVRDNKLIKQARGNLKVAATLLKGQLLLKGGLDVTNRAAAGRIGPLAGHLLFQTRYQPEKDQVQLERLDLSVANLPHLHATGVLTGLKDERTFALDLKADDLDLQQVSALLPPAQGEHLTLTGRLANTALHLDGSVKEGITAIKGGSQLRELSLTRGEQLVLSDLSSTVNVTKQDHVVLLSGEISSRTSKAALESIRAPFMVRLSPRFKVLGAHVNLSQARFLGLALTGQANYSRDTNSPFSTSFRATGTDLATITPLLTRHGLKISSGQGLATIRADGADPRNFTAAVDLTVAGVQGSRGQTAVTLGQGAATARITRSRGLLSVSGSGELKKLTTGNGSGQARLDYRLVDRQLTVENALVTWGRSTVKLARVNAVLPVAESRAGVLYHPLAVSFSDAEVIHKGAVVRDISGRLDALLAGNNSQRWLEGSAQLMSGRLLWQGKPVAAPLARIVFDRSGAKMNVKGTLLEGSLAGNGACNPFALNEGATFQLDVKGVDLPTAAGLLPLPNGLTITSGVLAGSLTGGYSGKNGLNAGMGLSGNGVTIAQNNRTLVSRADVSMAGNLTGQTLRISKAGASAGDGIRVTIDGALDNVFAKSRHGVFNFAVAQAPGNAYIDAFINSMPRIVQDATVSGSLAAQGTLTLQEGRSMLQGAILFDRIRLDLPERAISLQDLNGSFPFSLDLTGKLPRTIPTSVEFSRDNFPQLSRHLERQVATSQVVTIGRISLGKLELGGLTLNLKAGSGLTEIVTMKASLSEGMVRGTGWLQMNKGGNYRGDILVSGLSLKELCNRFPGIKGYISGRINGIVSLYGTVSNKATLTGFVELWANEGEGEKMLVSREFLQRLGGKKLSGIFFRSDIPYDRAEISALLEEGYLSFDTLDMVHTNMFGIRDLNVSIAPSQNRIALDYLIESIRQASTSGKAATGQGKGSGDSAPATEFKWEE